MRFEIKLQTAQCLQQYYSFKRGSVSNVIYNACVFMHTTIGFTGHLDQIYATEQIMQQICRF